MACTAVSTAPCAVITITARSASCSCALRISPSPSSPGIFRSVTTMSGANSSSLGNALNPSAAVSTEYPSSRSSSASAERALASSSTTSTLPFDCVWLIARTHSNRCTDRPWARTAMLRARTARTEPAGESLARISNDRREEYDRVAKESAMSATRIGSVLLLVALGGCGPEPAIGELSQAVLDERWWKDPLFQGSTPYHFADG